MKLPSFEPYKTKMVEPVYTSTRDQRIKWIEKVRYNLFSLKSEQVTVDLLTDSGTGAMSDSQWAAIMTGDESYAGASSFYNLKDAIKDLTGFDYILPTHQGRAAENVLFSVLIKEGDLVPGNSHFDTTRGHIEFRKAKALDCTIMEPGDLSRPGPFKGDADVEKMEDLLRSAPQGKVPCIVMTITNNTAGGQPVSMENLRNIRKLADKYGTLVVIDSARFAENAWFIKQREEGYGNKSIREIVLEIFSCADAMTMSSKKDGIVNIGGFIAFRNEDLYRKCAAYNIIYEGFVTYGGMAGRDMNALARGLYESTGEEYLSARIRQVELLGTKLKDAGIPLIEPFGGHAIFIDALNFYKHIPEDEFPGQVLAVELYIEGGIRSSEIGALMADRDPVTRENRFTGRELVRLAIPRRVYSDNHINYVAAAASNVFENRDSVKRGFRIISEAPLLRHFTTELERL
jgi:tryptophanase